MYISSGAMRKTRGFTLIELLVVVAIIGILSSVILSALTDARDKSRLATAMSTLRNIQEGINLCLNEPAVFACMPGANTGGCTASVTGDTQDGGGGILCPGSAGRYVSLPVGWLYCDTSGASGGCNITPNPTASVANSSTQTFNYILRAKRTSDGLMIQCQETGCRCSPGTGAACPAP